MVKNKELLDTILATGEIYGKTISKTAGVMFLADLSNYSSEQIQLALTSCRKELKAFPTVAEVIARIPDGRPGVEEAWAMIPKSESDSVVWTTEMAEAWGIARMIEEDPIAQRMAFKEAYSKRLSEARSANLPVNWQPSLGHDPKGRTSVVEQALKKGQLTLDYARQFLGYEGTERDLKRIGVDTNKLFGEVK